MNNTGFVLWFTGLSGSGKTTLAHELEIMLSHEYAVQSLDGDLIRKTLSHDLGFSLEDRKENIRRVGFVTQLLVQNGVIAIVSLISPLRTMRIAVRNIVEQRGAHFVEIYLDAPLEVCEERDKKGLYKRARAGEIKDFTGISQPYEMPLSPEIILHTHQWSISRCTTIIKDYLKSRKLISEDL